MTVKLSYFTDLTKGKHARPGQLLITHLKNTLKTGLSKEKGLLSEGEKKVLVYSLYLHDIAKVSDKFQKRLNGSCDKVPHSLPSAYAVAYLLSKHCKDDDCTKFIVTAYNAVRSHHGELHDIRDEEIDETDMSMFGSEGSRIWDEAVDALIESLDSVDRNLETYFLQLYLYSLLIYADRTDASGLADDELEIPHLSVQEYKESIKNDSDLNDDRDNLFNETSILDGKVIAINAPTGSGKTLAGLNLALRLAEKYGHDRVIYALPFVSIIDQVHGTVKELFKETGLPFDRYVIPHHYLAPVELKTANDRKLEGTEAEFLIENWDKPVILTTFVQFFNTLFKTKASTSKKFCNMVNSVVILDEIQSLPVEYWDLVGKSIRVLADRFNMRFILMSATLPRFLEKYDADYKMNVRNKEKWNRYEIKLINEREFSLEPVNVEELTNLVLRTLEDNPSRDIMVVLNTIKTVRDVYAEICGKVDNKTECVFLTSHVIPRDRIDRIRSVKRKQGEKRKVIITTQLIEAGVDMDVDIVFRDIAPLDSIVQTAGRCNRHGVKEKGIVYVVKVENDHGKSKKIDASLVYDRYVVKSTEKYLIGLGNSIDEQRITETMDDYYRKIREIAEKSNIGELAENLEFRSVRNGFELIDSKSITVFVVVDEESEEIFKKLKEIEKIPDYRQRKNEFLKIKSKLQEYVVTPSCTEEDIFVEDTVMDMYVVGSSGYDQTTGLKTVKSISNFI